MDLSLNLADVRAEVGRTNDGLVLVVSDGESTVTFADDGDHAETLAGIRRVSCVIWGYVLAVQAQRLAEDRARLGIFSEEELAQLAGNSGPGGSR